MKAAKAEWTEEHCKNIDVRRQQGSLQRLKALTKTKQHMSAVIEDSSGNILTESKVVQNRWTEYCCGVYNYELHQDTGLLQCNQTPTQEAESLLVLREEVEEAVRSLKAGKSPGVDNIPSELLKNGGEAITPVLTAIRQKMLETKKWPKEWTQSLVIPLPKKQTKKATSSNVETIVPSAKSAIPARPCFELS